jgi:hypothetical protein
VNWNQIRSNVLASVQVGFEKRLYLCLGYKWRFMINKFINYLSDTLHPKRRRTASSKAWEVELEQEEHSLSLSQHSSPSQSDQEQTPLMKHADSVSVSQGFHLFKRIPSNCQSNNSLASKEKELRNMAQGTRQDVQFLGEHQNQPKLEKFLHFVPTGRQAAQFSAVEQKSLEGGPVPNLVSKSIFPLPLGTHFQFALPCSCH